MLDVLTARDFGLTADLVVRLPVEAMLTPGAADLRVDALIEELIQLEAALPSPRRTRGVLLSGAANRLTRDGMVRLFEALRHVFRFAPGAISVAEIDLSAWSSAWASAAAFQGVGRARFSISPPAGGDAGGDRPELATLAQAIAALRDAHVPVLEVDLGVAFDLTGSALADVRQIVRSAPDVLRLSACAETGEVPGAARSAREVRAYLERAGYHDIGGGLFALPGNDPAATGANGVDRSEHAPIVIGAGARAAPVKDAKINGGAPKAEVDPDPSVASSGQSRQL